MTTADQKTDGRARCALSFLKSLGQAARDASLYKTNHPIAVAAIGKALKEFEAVLEETGRETLTVALADDRWLADECFVAPAAQGPEVVRSLFRSHGIAGLTFQRGVHLYEFSALCELASAAPKACDPGYLAEYLLQRGVKHVRPDRETFARVEPPPTAPAPQASPGPAAPNRSFATLLRGLVESAVQDPEERAHLYADALKLVKERLDRQVDESTEALRRERERIVQEQGRTDRVLAAGAEGKVVVDQQGNVVMMNPIAEQIAGKSLAEIAGRPIVTAVNAGEQMLTLSADLSLSDGKPPTEQVHLIADAAVERTLKRSVALIHDQAGRVVGTYSSLPDAAKFKEAQRLEEEFVSRVTHELRAPLTSIASALELLAQRLGASLGPEEAHFLEIGVRNSKRLEQMIAEILDFSKLESGLLKINPVPQEIAPILVEAAEGLSPWAKTRGVALSASPADPALGLVLADKARTLQIVTNLLSNAIKSTPEGGHITVGARRGEGELYWRAVVSVEDSGCGIAAGNLDRIFGKFVQLEASGYRREGIGLGLAIVKELVESHGGTVWAESEAGRGAIFRFSLPLADAPAAGTQCGFKPSNAEASCSKKD